MENTMQVAKKISTVNAIYNDNDIIDEMINKAAKEAKVVKDNYNWTITINDDYVKVFGTTSD